MYHVKNISFIAVAMAAISISTSGAAQVTYSNTKGGAVMVKPRPPSRDLVDILTGKSKKQKAQGLVWNEQIANIKQLLGQFPELKSGNGYYTGWRGDYYGCVDAQVNKAESSSRNWGLSSGDYGLSPDDASALPSAAIVSECLTNIKTKYEQKQNDRATEQARREKLAACEASPEGQIAQLSAEIAHARGVVGFAQAAINQDKKVEAVSGVVDLNTRHKMGELVVYGQQEIDNDFRKYRQLGGQATSADAVVPSSDPCKPLRQ